MIEVRQKPDENLFEVFIDNQPTNFGENHFLQAVAYATGCCIKKDQSALEIKFIFTNPRLMLPGTWEIHDFINKGMKFAKHDTAWTATNP
jgi:hypothetical protein